MNSNAAFNTHAELNLDPIKVKLMHKESGEGWSLEQVSAVEFEYRRFLCLMKLFPSEPVAPRVDVDIFWHYHILDTMKYAADCDQFFGYFLHHFPYSGLQGENAESDRHLTGARMQELYEATFGESYIRQGGSHAVTAGARMVSSATAWCVPTTTKASADTAWCVPTTAKAAANTAWCVPATTESSKTAWCVPATMKALARTAWCVPAITTPARYQPSSAHSAWCVPAGANVAWLPGATAIGSQPQAAATNDRLYPRPTLATAA